MALTVGFFNSKNGDKRYNAIDISKFFDGLITDGIYMHLGGRLMVTPSVTLGIQVATGRAWFHHVWLLNERVPLYLDFKPADRTYARIDSVVIYINENDRIATIKVLTGSPGAQPVSPFDLIRPQEGVYYHRLADVTIARNAVSISQSAIQNYVGTSETPYITAVLEGMNIDELIAQWHAQFGEWFSWVVGILDENYVGHLALWLKDLQASYDQHVIDNNQAHQNIQNTFNSAITNMNKEWTDRYNTTVTQFTNQVQYLEGYITELLDRVKELESNWGSIESEGKVYRGLTDSNEEPILGSDGTQLRGVVNVILDADLSTTTIEEYKGSYYVESTAFGVQTLNTAGKVLKENITIGKINVDYSTAASGGTVVDIAKQ